MYIDILIENLKEKGFKVGIKRQDIYINENLERPSVNKDNGYKLKKQFTNYLIKENKK